jgi:HlyD family secretion protein
MRRERARHFYLLGSRAYPTKRLEVGENIHAGQPVLLIEAAGAQWLSFNAREDRLRGLTVGSKVDVAPAGARETTPALVTELVALGSFATGMESRSARSLLLY